MDVAEYKKVWTVLRSRLKALINDYNEPVLIKKDKSSTKSQMINNLQY